MALGQPSAVLHLAPVELCKIDRFDHQRRQPAVADEIGDDPANKREHQPRTLDQQHGLHGFVRYLVENEQAAIRDLQQEQRLLFLDGVDPELQQHFERSGFGHPAGLQIDGEIDLRLADVHAHARILKREILDVLRHDLDYRRSLLAGRRLGSPIGISVRLRHEVFPIFSQEVEGRCGLEGLAASTDRRRLTSCGLPGAVG